MKKIIIVSSLLVGAFMVGCGSDGGECCNATRSLGGLGNIADGTENPVARFDVNWTNQYEGESAGSLDPFDTNTSSNSSDKKVIKYINFNFNCDDSFDQDEGNTSIEECAWNFTTPIENCLDQNSTVIGFVLPVQACAELIDSNMTVVLKVTDDENMTDEVNVTFGVTANDNIVTLTPTINR